ncbi:hypothetical protein Ahia01_001151600 [Argonauta hians]
MPNVLNVIINEIRKGSVIVDHSIQTANESKDALNNTLESIKTEGLKVGNKTLTTEVDSFEVEERATDTTPTGM